MLYIKLYIDLYNIQLKTFANKLNTLTLCFIKRVQYYLYKNIVVSILQTKKFNSVNVTFAYIYISYYLYSVIYYIYYILYSAFLCGFHSYRKYICVSAPIILVSIYFH